MSLSFNHLILLFILQSLCFAATFNSSFFSFHNNPSPPHANTYNGASNNGVVPILKDSNGFYVNVDLGPSTSSNQTQNNTAKMMLILVKNETMLASNCWNFSPYDCNSYQCSMYAIYSTFAYPWFISNNRLAKAFVSLDSSYWELNNYANVATTCGGNNENIGTGRYGAIGLGYAKANFLKEVLFSIWIDQNLDNGILLFGNDTAKYASSSEICSFSTNQYWTINAYGGSVSIGTKSFNFNGVLAFDINSDVPGFDTNTFNTIVNYIKSYSAESQVTCSSSVYKPVCNYTGSFAFPDIKIMIKNNAWIPLSSDLIYINKTDSLFTLNMKILSQNLNGENYITPDYNGMVVLDAKTMSQFYLIFNGINQTIHFHNANTSPGTSWEWLYIVIFTIIGLIFISVLVYFMVKVMMESEEEAEKPVYILNAENSRNNPSSHQAFHSNEKR